MIITIDGNAASGKTTLTQYLSNIFNLTILDINTPILHEIWEHQIITHEPKLAKGIARFCYRLMTQHSCRWYDEHRIITDEFWLALWELDKSCSVEIDRMFKVMETIMTANDGMMPDLSFYLEINMLESHYRRKERDAIQKGAPLPKRDRDNEYADPVKDECDRKFWRWLSDKIPYLHIIDAMCTPNEVKSEIVDIILCQTD